VDSVLSQEARDIEVIIVDNGSKDGTGEYVKENYKQVTLINNHNNVGSSKARNQGIGIAKGEWVLTLDSDVILGEDFISEFSLIKNHLPQDIGMLQPNILNSDRKTSYSQGIYLSKLRRFYDVNRDKPGNLINPKTGNIIGSCSAAAFYRRSMLNALRQETGYFDERFFFLAEDVDLAWRAKKSGWKVLFYPKMLCFHSGNGAHTQSRLRQYLCFRNRHLMINKNESFLAKLGVYFISIRNTF